MNVIEEQTKNENQKTSKKQKFTLYEDELLKRIVFRFGPKNWKLIASMIPGRTSRQCRDRYSNYLAPGYNHNKWSEEEDMILIEKYKILGPRWTLIHQFFPNRTPNSIKNHYNYCVCKKMNNSNILTLNSSNENEESFKNEILPDQDNDIDIFSNENLIDFDQEHFEFYDEESFFGDNEDMIKL